MRISLAVSALLALIITGMGWDGGQRLSRAREENAKLSRRASELGIALDDKGAVAKGFRASDRSAQDRSGEARQAAAEMVSIVQEMEKKSKEGGTNPGPEMQQRMMALLDTLASFDTAALKACIAALRADPDVKPQTREGLVGFTILMLASEHPQAALSLFSESSDLVKAENPMNKQVLASALSRLAKDSPMAALDWVRKNGEKFPDLVDDEAKRGIIRGTAGEDPKLAFQLIGELKLKDQDDAVRDITQTADTPARRDRILAALREQMKTETDPKKAETFSRSLVANLAGKVAKDGFESASQWLDSAKLSPKELDGLAEGEFTYQIKSADSGKWAEWVGGKLPAEKADAPIRNMVSEWTRKDYQAAGQWLDGMPADSPARNPAIRAYADAVAKYDPGAAVEWAELLPADKNREATFRKIYQNWPDKESSPEAAAFAEKHGIKR